MLPQVCRFVSRVSRCSAVPQTKSLLYPEKHSPVQWLIWCKSQPFLFSAAFAEFEKYEAVCPTVQPHIEEVISLN